jgi:2-oxoglutarate/2-oxoacid ferredoxin oxidoreductase subunit beta
VYGLTKGQFSASADVGSVSKRGEVNRHGPIEPMSLALTLGATFVARSFSGDKQQLVPILKAGLTHRGFAIVDVISPCVTFNDHEGSTKSYVHTRTHSHEVVHTDFVPLRTEITAEQDRDDATAVTMHDGSTVMFRSVAEDYDPTDREAALSFLRAAQIAGEVATGLLYLEESGEEMHTFENTADRSLADVPFGDLCPGSAGLEELQKEWR